MGLPANVPQITADPGLPPALRPKRARVSEKKRRKARELEQKLLNLQSNYGEAELVEILQRAILDARRLGQATRKSDRDSVLLVLERYDAAEMCDLDEETGLSRWVIQQILDEFIDKGLIGKRPVRDPADAGGRPRDVYYLIHF